MKPLAVIGNVNVDLIMGPAAPWPQPGTEIIVDHHELRVGGSAGNTALAFMALGIPFTIAANVGDDQFGRWLRDEFGAQAAEWPSRPEGTTVSVGITHPDGERTFFTTRGHLPHFSLADARAFWKAPRSPAAMPFSAAVSSRIPSPPTTTPCSTGWTARAFVPHSIPAGRSTAGRPPIVRPPAAGSPAAIWRF